MNNCCSSTTDPYDEPGSEAKPKERTIKTTIESPVKRDNRKIEKLEVEETEQNYEDRDPNPLTRQSQEDEPDVENLRTEDSKVDEEEKVQLHSARKVGRREDKKSSSSSKGSDEDSKKNDESSKDNETSEPDETSVDPSETNDESQSVDSTVVQHKQALRAQLKEEQERYEKKGEEMHQQRLEFWSKKKIGFVNLKSWQEDRSTILSLHKRILESVFKTTIEKMKTSARESQKMILYFMAISEQEKQCSDTLTKNISYIPEVKKTYQTCGKGLYDLCEAIEAYETKCAKDKLYASKMIKEIVDETLGAIFKKQIQKIDEFTANVNKITKKLTHEEKECEKSYQNFTNMLEEAEVCMNHHRHYDKDFWLAENQCLVTSQKQFEVHQELCKEVVDVWNKSEAIEEVRVKNMKQLYESYFTKTAIYSDNSKNLLQIIAKTNEDEISSKLYNFKNMFLEDDIKAFDHLAELLGVKIDLMSIDTNGIKEFLMDVHIKDAPQTTFIMKEGVLKRDPGFMKSWKDSICIITTEGFLHGFSHKTDKDPSFTINCRRMTITPKKETKFEVSEEKKGIFSSHKKINFKTTSLIEMEEWIKALNKFDSEG